MVNDFDTNHLVIGSGIAGLTLAYKLAQKEKVVIISKDNLLENNTVYAQGGIASVLSPEDSFEQHIADTKRAGAGLCHSDIVEMIVKGGPDAIQELIELGVHFTKDQDSEYHLTKEGGHSQRRVVHAHDLTGREVLRALYSAVAANPNITVYENTFVVDLITTDRFRPIFGENICMGCYVFDKVSGEVRKVLSQRTYLCTGGHGKVYRFTSNPKGATGDGLAMAWRAGCKVANLEFMQFHPTCLFHPNAKNFLISEAVRGEGAELLDVNYEPFMQRYHELGSLAPRDIVARAIDSEIKRKGASHLYLDARLLGEKKIKAHFPNIYNTCVSFGIDITKDLIPVVPAAHYSCGGIVIDRNGRSNVQNLFALGEVACSGLHGANRLASNSLLEALVYADRVANYAAKHQCRRIEPTLIPDWQPSSLTNNLDEDEMVVLSHTWDEIRHLMWNYVGIVRTQRRLKRAAERIINIRKEVAAYYWNHKVCKEVLEVRNLADVAYLTISCAMRRKESRGIHYILDYPDSFPDEQAIDTVISGAYL